jgi:release factor glutamine methyltransferase
MNAQNKTVGYILETGAGFLKKKGVENPRLICEMLLSRLTGWPRLELGMHHSEELSEVRLDAMRRGIKRAASGEPVQYITGEAGFMDSVLKVDRRALIPRPETEVLVNLVLNCEAVWKNESPAIIDVGTGSGCIVLSLALARKNARYLALDTSDEALALARENAEKLDPKAQVHFVNADMSDVVEPESIDAVVANLPYIPSEVCDRLPPMVRDHEPRSALDGGPDGLRIIESVVQDAAIVLKNEGMIFLEIGEEQAAAVKSLLEECGFSDVTVTQDLNGRDRVVSGSLAM